MGRFLSPQSLGCSDSPSALPVRVFPFLASRLWRCDSAFPVGSVFVYLPSFPRVAVASRMVVIVIVFVAYRVWSTAYKTWVYGGTGTGLFFTFLGVNMGLFTALCIQCEPSPSKKFKKRQEARMNSLIMGCVTFASFLILIVTVLICAHLGLKFNNVIFPKYGFSTWFFIYIGGLVIVSICALTLVFRYTCMDDGQGDGDWAGGVHGRSHSH
eukprot:g15165.t1